MLIILWDVKDFTHYSKKGRVIPVLWLSFVCNVVAVLCVVNTGPMLIAVSITEMVIMYKYVQPTNILRTSRKLDSNVFLKLW